MKKSPPPVVEGFWTRLGNRLTGPACAGIWRRRLLAAARTMTPPDASSLVVIAPHQDDETLGCGGLIAMKRQRGAHVSVVFLTDGSASPSRGGEPVAGWIGRRRAEARSALDILGVPPDQVHFLDGPDGGLASLDSTRRAGLADRLALLLSAARPRQIAVTFHRDGHPDHEAAHEICLQAICQLGLTVELWEYPIWSYWRMPPDGTSFVDLPGLGKLDVSGTIGLKKRALACFTSQLGPGPGRVPAALVRRLTGEFELFFTSSQPDKLTPGRDECDRPPASTVVPTPR